MWGSCAVRLLSSVSVPRYDRSHWAFTYIVSFHPQYLVRQQATISSLAVEETEAQKVEVACQGPQDWRGSALKLEVSSAFWSHVSTPLPSPCPPNSSQLKQIDQWDVLSNAF